MFDTLPSDPKVYMNWSWDQFKPYTDALLERELTDDNIVEWLTDWAHLWNILGEMSSRLNVATTVDTTDAAAEKRLMDFMQNISEQLQPVEQQLREKLLATGIEPPDFGITMRNFRVSAALFRQENVPLFTEEIRLAQEYDKVIGAQTVQWDGEEKTLAQVRPLLQEADRDLRERAWRAMMARGLADRGTLNDLWVELLKLRMRVAANADEPNFLSYSWKRMNRFDYTPDDCLRFHQAIEETVVPVAERRYNHRREQLGVDSLRPWDTAVDPLNRPPLRPFTDIDSLSNTLRTIFNRVDPELGAHFETMQQQQLLDLDNRKGKAPGGYLTTFGNSKQPFIFMNAVGTHDDVQTLLHEGGHAFHAFAEFTLPEYQQTDTVPIEFAEVASMTMELLGAPYLAKSEGGFYNDSDAARARIEHLEGLIEFWPYMAVVDAFQHWVYTHPQDAMNPDNCDEEWARQWDRFMRGIDYSGLQAEKETGWHRKLHIFQIPFYYVEYGLAQLGAVQVWNNSLKDAAGATRQYRQALALGGTVTLPELFSKAGANFAMDSATLNQAVSLAERTIQELEQA